jgi:hypothetical protein
MTEMITIEIPKKHAKDIAVLFESVLESQSDYCTEDENEQECFDAFIEIPSLIRKQLRKKK